MLSQHVRRVDQLDAAALDTELFSLLNTQYRKSFLYFPSSVTVRAGPELDVLFRFLFKFLPLEFLGSTFGQNLFKLKYCNSKTNFPATKNKLRLLAALTVGLPWFWDRVLRKLILSFCRSSSSQRIAEASFRLESNFLFVWRIFSLINYCVFLQRSKFSSVTERLLQVRPLYTSSQEIKILQYDGISKELLWHGLDELLGFTLSVINVFRIKNYLKRVWSSLCSSDPLPKSRRKNTDCYICGNIPNFPHAFGCEHHFCYYCIASMLIADPTFVCVDCNFAANGINSIKPVPINKLTVKNSNLC